MGLRRSSLQQTQPHHQETPKGLGSCSLPKFHGYAPTRSTWNQRRDDSAIVFSIDEKIPIQGQYSTLRMVLSHPNQTGVCQGHWNIRIATDQTHYALCFILQLKRGLNHSPIHQLQDSSASSRKVTQKKTGLGQNRFTGKQRRGDSRPFLFCPLVEPVIPVEECNQRARINNDGLEHRTYRPKSFK